MMMLLALPEDLLCLLLGEWIDPEVDLRALAHIVPEVDRLIRRTVTIRATEVLSASCLAWLADRAVRVQLLEEELVLEGHHIWRQNGVLHRDGDLPAIVFADGAQSWHQRGVHHRDGDLPAFVSPSGHQEWWKHGLRHRDGGRPAIVYFDGTLMFFEQGEKC